MRHCRRLRRRFEPPPSDRWTVPAVINGGCKAWRCPLLARNGESSRQFQVADFASIQPNEQHWSHQCCSFGWIEAKSATWNWRELSPFRASSGHLQALQPPLITAGTVHRSDGGGSNLRRKRRQWRIGEIHGGG